MSRILGSRAPREADDSPDEVDSAPQAHYSSNRHHDGPHRDRFDVSSYGLSAHRTRTRVPVPSPRRTVQPDQLDHLAPELRRTRWMSLCLANTSSAQSEGVHGTGATPDRTYSDLPDSHHSQEAVSACGCSRYSSQVGKCAKVSKKIVTQPVDGSLWTWTCIGNRLASQSVHGLALPSCLSITGATVSNQNTRRMRNTWRNA